MSIDPTSFSQPPPVGSSSPYTEGDSPGVLHPPGAYNIPPNDPLKAQFRKMFPGANDEELDAMTNAMYQSFSNDIKRIEQMHRQEVAREKEMNND